MRFTKDKHSDQWYNRKLGFSIKLDVIQPGYALYDECADEHIGNFASLASAKRGADDYLARLREEEI